MEAIPFAVETPEIPFTPIGLAGSLMWMNKSSSPQMCWVAQLSVPNSVLVGMKLNVLRDCSQSTLLCRASFVATMHNSVLSGMWLMGVLDIDLMFVSIYDPCRSGFGLSASCIRNVALC